MNGQRIENPAPPPEHEAPPPEHEAPPPAPTPGEEEMGMEVDDCSHGNGHVESDPVNPQGDAHTHPGPDHTHPGGDAHTHPQGDPPPSQVMMSQGDPPPSQVMMSQGDPPPSQVMMSQGDPPPSQVMMSQVVMSQGDPPPSQVMPVAHDGLCIGRRGNYNSDDSSSDSDSSSSSSCGTLAAVLGEDDDDDEGFSQEKKPAPIRTIDEILPEELPAVEEVCISLPEEAALRPVGAVTSIIQQLVVVQSLKETPPLKDDSVIFNSDRLAVAKVFEVFGPVCSPLYVLRFSSEQQVQQKHVELGQTLYYTPEPEYSDYIFTEQLKHLKGSDASWKNDQEPPADELDFSDDETEQQAKRKKKKKPQKKREATPPDSSPRPHPGGDFFRPAVSQRPLQQQQHRDPRGFPPRHAGAPFYRQQHGPPRHTHPHTHHAHPPPPPPPPQHYLPPPCPYPPPYQPQAYPPYPPPPWPPYHNLPFSHLPPLPPPPPPPGM